MKRFRFRKRKETRDEKIIRLCKELRSVMGNETIYIFDYSRGGFSVNNQSDSINLMI